MNKNRSIRVAAFCLGLMLAGSLQVHAQKVTFRDGTVSLKQAFEKIEASSKYKIAYNDSHLNVSRKVSLNQKETEVLEILATILKDTGYTYKKNGNYIVIVPVEQKPASKVKKVKGVVKDASGEAIIGANVLVKGTATGVITDMNGSFELEVPGNAVLQITYIGYVQQDVAVKNRDQLAVLLKEDTKTLDEGCCRRLWYNEEKGPDRCSSISEDGRYSPKYDIYSEPCVSRKSSRFTGKYNQCPAWWRHNVSDSWSCFDRSRQ